MIARNLAESRNRVEKNGTGERRVRGRIRSSVVCVTERNADTGERVHARAHTLGSGEEPTVCARRLMRQIA